MQSSHKIITLCMTLLLQTICGIPQINFFNGAPTFGGSSPSATNLKTSSNFLDLTSETSDINYNSSDLRSEISANDSSLETDQTNSTSSVGDQFQSAENSTNSVLSSLSTQKVTTPAEKSGNESQSSSHSSSETSSTGTGGTMSTHSVSMTSKTQDVNGSVPVTDESIDENEPEGVARGKPFDAETVNATVVVSESLYQKTLALMSDTYTLSILVPVAAGIVFASTIIVTIATCRCLRRRCRRRRLRRKTLPDSVKNLRPSDRARLLAESSDEEF